MFIGIHVYCWVYENLKPNITFKFYGMDSNVSSEHSFCELLKTGFKIMLFMPNSYPTYVM